MLKYVIGGRPSLLLSLLSKNLKFNHANKLHVTFISTNWVQESQKHYVNLMTWEIDQNIVILNLIWYSGRRLMGSLWDLDKLIPLTKWYH